MSTKTRLYAVAPDLVELRTRLSPNERTVIARRIAGWACRETSAMIFLCAGRAHLLLDDTHTVTPKDRERLAGDVCYLDEKYLAIAEQHDGLGDAGEVLRWFCKARAAASLLYSLDSDSVQGFCETLYEAQAATNDLHGLKALCGQK